MYTKKEANICEQKRAVLFTVFSPLLQIKIPESEIENRQLVRTYCFQNVTEREKERALKDTIHAHHTHIRTP